MKFPEELQVKIDTRKVHKEVIKVWYTNRVTELLGFEDEVVIGWVDRAEMG